MVVCNVLYLVGYYETLSFSMVLHILYGIGANGGYFPLGESSYPAPEIKNWSSLA